MEAGRNTEPGLNPAEMRILKELVNYWDGKTPQYPNGPMPPPGDWVAEIELARKMGYEVRGSRVLDHEFRTAIELLKKRDLIRRAWKQAESGRWQIQPTAKGKKKAD
jgi:hypothetical protein